ncbi:MAG: hypothetical protein ACYDHW_04285 [Syntrophorhabdaceae bacterium]
MNNLVDVGVNSRLPVVPNTHRSGLPRRDNEDSRDYRNAVPSFLVEFNNEVAISSRRRENELAGEDNLLAVIQAPGKQVEKSSRIHPVISPHAGILLNDSETIQESRSVDPYNLRAGQKARQRYTEANSLEIRYSATFEITV